MGDGSCVPRAVLCLKAVSVCSFPRGSAADGVLAVPGVSAGRCELTWRL